MRMMGMSMKIYWFVSYLFYLCQYLCMIAIMWLTGLMANLQFFMLHDGFIIFHFLFAWGNVMIMLSFLLSIFFRNSRIATAAMFLFMLLVNTTGSSLLDTM